MSDYNVSNVIYKIHLLGDMSVDKNKILLKNVEICFQEEFLSSFGLNYINSTLNLYNDKNIKIQGGKYSLDMFRVIKKHNFRGKYEFSFIYDIVNYLSYNKTKNRNFQIKEEFLPYLYMPKFEKKLGLKREKEMFEDKKISKEYIFENSQISTREGIKNETFHSFLYNSDKNYSNLNEKQGKIILRIIKYNKR